MKRGRNGGLQDFWFRCLEILLVLSMEMFNCKRKLVGGKIRDTTGTWTSPMWWPHGQLFYVTI